MTSLDQLLPIDQALEKIRAGVNPMPGETVPLEDGLGRVLAEDLTARLTQPPADVSAMDGYAVRAEDVAHIPVTLDVIGESAAGRGYYESIGKGQAARIFTGAPLPPGADTIIMQENTRAGEGRVEVLEGAALGRFVRPRGMDFKEGDVLLPKGRLITARNLSLAAAMNQPTLTVARKPRVGLLANGDELVKPGEIPGPGQIIGSNAYGLAGAIRAMGGEPVDFGTAPDDLDAIRAMVEAAQGVDLLVTMGGASVGDHDLIKQVLDDLGVELQFKKVAIQPGKPTIFGHLKGVPFLGLPGNPVSALVTAQIFVAAAVEAMLGRERRTDPLETARLVHDMRAGHDRQEYMRGSLSVAADGMVEVDAFAAQDSSLLARLAAADCLVVRPIHAPAAKAGDRVPILRLYTGTVVF